MVRTITRFLVIPCDDRVRSGCGAMPVSSMATGAPAPATREDRGLADGHRGVIQANTLRVEGPEKTGPSTLNPRQGMIVTVNVQVEVLPNRSIAVQVTWVSPSGNRCPNSGLHVIVTTPLSSVAVTP
jgi:hypothetical protein